MEPMLILLGGGGLIAAALALLIWRLVKNYGEKEVLERDNQGKDIVLDKVMEAKKARQRVESEPDFANKLREKYTRD